MSKAHRSRSLTRKPDSGSKPGPNRRTFWHQSRRKELRRSYDDGPNSRRQAEVDVGPPEPSHRGGSGLSRRRDSLWRSARVRWVTAFAGTRLAYPATTVVLAFLSASLIGVTFGFMPARSASRLDPVEVLARLKPPQLQFLTTRNRTATERTTAAKSRSHLGGVQTEGTSP
jgi:hypothetical protein